MKLRQFIAATLLLLLGSASAFAQVSVSIGQPGFYGRLDIGGFPAPPLLFPEPMIIRPAPVAYPPLYLRVPPGHSKHWGRYCGRYNACGRPVYFVRDDWYRNEYAPAYRERHYGDRGGYREGYRDGYRDERRYDRREFRGDDRGDRGDRGHGHGHGHGH